MERKNNYDDPEAYIYSAIQHLENLEDNLKDEEFRIKTRINQLTRESEETQTSMKAYLTISIAGRMII